jgi:hypothetical protein
VGIRSGNAAAHADAERARESLAEVNARCV